MTIRHTSILLALWVALSAFNPVWAADGDGLPATTSEMTQEEYAAYRARIREQLDAAPQAENKDEATATTHRRNNNGYGQGYRARQERSRSGGMGYGGGRGR